MHPVLPARVLVFHLLLSEHQLAGKRLPSSASDLCHRREAHFLSFIVPPLYPKPALESSRSCVVPERPRDQVGTRVVRETDSVLGGVGGLLARRPEWDPFPGGDGDGGDRTVG